MSTATASEVNKRIAEWMGHRDFEYVTLDDGSLMARRTSDGAALHEFPDYMHDANAAIAAAEKLCRDADVICNMRTDGEQSGVQFVRRNKFPISITDEHRDKSLATAISLALFAVLGEGS